MSPAPFPFYLDLFLRALPPLLVVGGWVVIYHLQALQARRKLLREEAEKARIAVTALQEAAIEFHTSTFSASRKLAVHGMLTDLDRRRDLIPALARPKQIFKFVELPLLDAQANILIDAKLIVELRQAITLEHFEDPTAAPLSADDPQLKLIAQKCLALVSEIDRILIAALD